LNPAQRRIKRAIRRLGDAFTVGGVTRYGVFAVMAPGRAASYLLQGVIEASDRPMRMAYVAYDDVTAVTDTVTFDAQTYVVQKVIKARVRGEAVARLLVMV